jgi:SPP1 family predicted phage head-tail adaptor
MTAGQMRDWLQILTPAVTDDGRGGQTVVYPASGPWVAAYVRAASHREQAAAGALQTVATHVVEVYYDPRITADKRLRRVGPARPTLEIVGVREDDRRRVLTLDCAEVI